MKKILIIEKTLRRGKHLPPEWNPFSGFYPKIFELLVFLEDKDRNLADKLFPDAHKIWFLLLALAEDTKLVWPHSLEEVKKVILSERIYVDDFLFQKGSRRMAYEAVYLIWLETRKVRIRQAAEDHNRFLERKKGSILPKKEKVSIETIAA